MEEFFGLATCLLKGWLIYVGICVVATIAIASFGVCLYRRDSKS